MDAAKLTFGEGRGFVNDKSARQAAGILGVMLGYDRIPQEWKGGIAKIAIALAKGKKSHDKREATKDRDWKRDQSRLLRQRG